jgi:hypothetical protein
MAQNLYGTGANAILSPPTKDFFFDPQRTTTCFVDNSPVLKRLASKDEGSITRWICTPSDPKNCAFGFSPVHLILILYLYMQIVSIHHLTWTTHALPGWTRHDGALPRPLTESWATTRPRASPSEPRPRQSFSRMSDEISRMTGKIIRMTEHCTNLRITKYFYKMTEHCSKINNKNLDNYWQND